MLRIHELRAHRGIGRRCEWMESVSNHMMEQHKQVDNDNNDHHIALMHDL